MIQLRGEDSIFFIKYNNVWCPIACETSNSFSENVEMISTTTRDNGGWVSQRPTNQSYSISLEAVLTIDNESEGSNIISYNKIRKMKRDLTLIEWKRETWSGWYIDSGKAHISDISDSNVVGEDITFSLTLVGFGAPLEDTARVSVLGTDDETMVGDNDNNLIQV